MKCHLTQDSERVNSSIAGEMSMSSRPKVASCHRGISIVSAYSRPQWKHVIILLCCVLLWTRLLIGVSRRVVVQSTVPLYSGISSVDLSLKNCDVLVTSIPRNDVQTHGSLTVRAWGPQLDSALTPTFPIFPTENG